MKKVLVAPLDWGLGHATRCIPVIRALKEAGADVLIAAEGKQKNLLSSVFPESVFIDIPGYGISYPASGSMAVSMLAQARSILAKISMEHRLLGNIISQYNITHVISDNRYGLWSPNVRTAFVTHQIHIQAPLLVRQILFQMNRSFISRFNELWIPDVPPPHKLSGELSSTSGINLPVKYLGPLSRFSSPHESPEKKYDVIALLSGPEPQRTILENILLTAFPNNEKSMLVVRGLPGENATPSPKSGITFLNHIADHELAGIFHPQTLVLCRPGYSTLMDLFALKHQKALFIPTPGQTEQEYLSNYWEKKFHFPYAKQKDFDWKMTLDCKEGTLPAVDGSYSDGLKNAVTDFLG